MSRHANGFENCSYSIRGVFDVNVDVTQDATFKRKLHL